jgi:hypothetical protein
MIKKIVFVYIILCWGFHNFPEKLGILQDIVRPATVNVDGKQLYIAENNSIFIYSIDPYVLVKKFGVKGEGPGEFKGIPYISLISDQLLINDWGKLLVFSKQGGFIREIKLPFNYFYINYPLLPVKDNFLGFQLSRVEVKPGFIFRGKIYGRDLKLLTHFYEGGKPWLLPPPRPGTKPKKTDFNVIPHCIDYAVAEDKIFVADSRKGFNIFVFDHQGKPIYAIKHNYKKIKVTNEFKDNYMKNLRESGNWEQLKTRYDYRFKEFYPAFYGFKIKQKKIYVTTYKSKDKKHEIVVLDLKGNVLKKSMVFPFNRFNRSVEGFHPFSSSFDVWNDVIYYLVENADEERWELYSQVIE